MASTNSTNLTATSSTSGISSSNAATDMKVGRVRGYQEICIFENQRYRPLFGWGAKGFLFPHDRSPYSDETGQVSYSVNSLEEIPPPPNCEWVTPWKFNQDYTNVDGEGWCYASSFPRLSEKLNTKTSSNTSRPTHVVRRRMWSRYAKRLRSSLPPPELNQAKTPSTGTNDSHPQGLFPFSPIKNENSRNSEQDSADIITAVIYENERLLLTAEGSSPSWSVLHLSEDLSDWPPFSDVTGKHELPRLGAVKVKWGYQWLSDWECITIRNITDIEGWIYAPSFSELGQLLSSNNAPPSPDVSQDLLCCRSRKWERKMAKGNIQRENYSHLALTPFELSITVLEVGGLSGINGMVKVEVAVEDAIAGITSGRSTNTSTPGIFSGFALQNQMTNTIRLLWTNSNQFSIPLASLENHNISLTLYCEIERQAPLIIGTAKNDSTLGTLLWSQMNRKFEMGLPVTMDEKLETLSPYSSPYVMVQLQLREHSLFNLSMHPDLPSYSSFINYLSQSQSQSQSLLSLPPPPLLSALSTVPTLSHTASSSSTPSSSSFSSSLPSSDDFPHPMDYLNAHLTSLLQQSELVPTDAQPIAAFILSRTNIQKDRASRSPLLVLSRFHLQDICSDYRPLASASSLPGTTLRTSIFPLLLNGHKKEKFSYSVTNPRPLPRQLLHLSNMYSTNQTALSTFSATIETNFKEIHSFDFLNPTLLMSFLKSIAKGRLGSIPSEEFHVSYLLHNDNKEPLPVSSLLTIATINDQTTLSWRNDSSSSSSSSSSDYNFSLQITDIENITSSSLLPLSASIMLDLDILDLLSKDVRSGTVVMLSLLTLSGQYETCVFSCEDTNSRQSGKIHFFCNFDEIRKGSVLIGLHIQENSSKEFQTIGEALLPISSLLYLDADQDSSSFPCQIPKTIQFRLEPPRFALMLSFVHAFELLPMNLDKTSDPYCIIRFVDDKNKPVVPSSQAGFRTKYVSKTLNPVWNQQLVFHCDSGFLRATYIHIEVWDHDVVTTDSCMGEVFLSLRKISSTLGRLSLPLEWSPLMSPDKRKNTQNFGTLVIDARTISTGAAEDNQFSKYSRYFTPNCQRGFIEMTVVTTPVSASCTNWIAHPLDNLNEKGSPLELFGCCLRQHHPGLLLFPMSTSSEETLPSRNGEETSEKSSRFKFEFQKTKKLSHPDMSSKISVSFFLEYCLERSSNGVACIPWNQVVDLVALTSSTVLLTCSIHRRIVSGGTISFHKVPIEIVIGPCPAESVIQQIKDAMEMFPIQESINQLLSSSSSSNSTSNSGPPDITDLRTVLKDLSQLLALTRLDFQRLLSESNFQQQKLQFSHPDPSKGNLFQEYLDLTVILQSSMNLPLIESWISVLRRQTHILLLVARLICVSSRDITPPPASIDNMHQLVETKCEEAGFPLSFSSSTLLNQNERSDLTQVVSLIEIFENVLLEMILMNWNNLTSSNNSLLQSLPSSQISPKLFDAFCDEVVRSSRNLPKLSWMLQSAINSFYNRIISLIGKSVDRKEFEKIEGNQNRLDLIAFVITEDDRISSSLEELLSLVGLHITPSPMLSLTLNIEGLLDRFASILTLELKKYLTQAIGSCRTTNTSSSLSSPLASEKDEYWKTSVPWEIRTIDKTKFVGPLPELIFEIFQTFLEMATSPDSYPDNSKISRLRLLNMNKVVIHSVLSSYDHLMDEYHRIFASLSHMFDYLRDASLGEDESCQFMLQTMNLLCSIANDCDRISTLHVSKLWKKAVVALTVDEIGTEVSSTSHTYLTHLSNHVDTLQLEIKRIAWTAIELLTRIIFVDMREIFLDRFENILEQTEEGFPIFSSILRTLEDYLTDFKNNLLPEYFQVLVLSCGHKILHRYFQKLYDYSRGISRGELTQHPLLTEAIKLGRNWRPPVPLSQTQCSKIRYDLVELLNLSARVLDHSSFHQIVICNQIRQLDVFIDALEYSPSQLEFTTALEQISTLCGYRLEPLLAIAVLKGMDSQGIRDLEISQSPIVSLAPDWNNAALLYTFCEEDMAGINQIKGTESSSTSSSTSLFSKLKSDLAERHHLSLEPLGVLMGLDGPNFKGLNDQEFVSKYYSSSGSAPIHEGRERFTLSISQLQCRGIVASHHFRLGRSLVFVRLIHLLHQQQTKPVVSNLSPSWQDTLTVNSQLADLRNNGLLLEVIEYNWLIKRYSEIATCRIDIPRITPQSPPFDEWIRLEKVEHRSRSRSDHLFPIAAGVKFAAETVAGVAIKLDPFQSSIIEDAALVDTSSASRSMDLMIHVHITFTYIPESIKLA